MTNEKIHYESSNKDAWVCICGNTPSGDGFYPCDYEGNEIEPGKSANWGGLYVCGKCGRIINQDSLEVIGRNQLIKPIASNNV
ncbi:MAG: hypothetical protein H0X33_14570 [Taibaiella sp.]|nr:hypothetical protein [Taibaiella sp.]